MRNNGEKYIPYKDSRLPSHKICWRTPSLATPHLEKKESICGRNLPIGSIPGKVHEVTTAPSDWARLCAKFLMRFVDEDLAPSSMGHFSTTTEAEEHARLSGVAFGSFGGKSLDRSTVTRWVGGLER